MIKPAKTLEFDQAGFEDFAWWIEKNRKIARKIVKLIKLQKLALAAANHRSMEEEARQIPRSHLLRERCFQGVGTKISQRFAALGGIELPVTKRSYPQDVRTT